MRDCGGAILLEPTKQSPLRLEWNAPGAMSGAFLYQVVLLTQRIFDGDSGVGLLLEPFNEPPGKFGVVGYFLFHGIDGFPTGTWTFATFACFLFNHLIFPQRTLIASDYLWF